MKKITTLLFVSGFAVLCCSCSDKEKTLPHKLPDLKNNDMSMHQEIKSKPGEEKSGIAQAVKNNKLNDYPDITIGKAFDSYSRFTKREWKETFADRGKIYLDFIGWVPVNPLDQTVIKQGISAKGVQIKFLVIADEPFRVVMASRLEVRTDGKQYEFPISDIKAVLNSIYSNQEIIF